MSQRAASLSFRLKLTVFAAALSATPAIVIGWFLIDVNSETVQRASRELQIAVAADVARTVTTDAEQVAGTLGSIARTLSSVGASEELRLRVAEALLTSSTVLPSVHVYDADGLLIDAIRRGGHTSPPAPERLGRGLMVRARHDGVAVDAVSRHDDGLQMTVVVPIRSGESVTGFAASPTDLDRLQRRVEQLHEAHLRGQRGAVWVVDDRRRVIAHSDIERADALVDASQHGALAGIDIPLLDARVSRAAEFHEASGEAMVGTVVGVAARPWAVVVQAPRAVAYASIAEMRRIVFIALTLTVCFAVALAFLLARRLSAPILELVAFARHLAARRFDQRVTVTTRDELATLAAAMNDAASELDRSERRIREEMAIRGDLGRYLPAALVDKIVQREQDMELGGQRRVITVLFADVVAFTPLSERLPAEEVVALLNELFTLLTEVVFRHGGTVDKLIGDCVMALWGAPAAGDDHAARALQAAEDMIHWLESANAGWQERFGVTLQLAIGVHTGEAVIGNVGSKTRMEYTAIGDVVNVAARLETVARPQQILITAATREAAGEQFRYNDLGEQTLAGRSAPVRIFEVRT